MKHKFVLVHFDDSSLEEFMLFDFTNNDSLVLNESNEWSPYESGKHEWGSPEDITEAFPSAAIIDQWEEERHDGSICGQPGY